MIEKDTFEDYKLQNVEVNDLTMSREEAIQIVAASLGEKDCIVSTTGMISRELFEYRAAMNQGHERDFLTVGSMGHASQIALGIALAQPNRKVWCFDGDGATIMHMGSMAIVANKAPKNYVHVVFNNGAHDSVGGQPTVGLKIDLPPLDNPVPNSSIKIGDLIHRADDAMKSTLYAYKENAVKWWGWLKEKSGDAKVINDLIAYLNAIPEEVEPDADMRSTEDYKKKLEKYVEAIKK